MMDQRQQDDQEQEVPKKLSEDDQKRQEAKERYTGKKCPLMSTAVGGKADCLTVRCAWWYDDFEYGGDVGCVLQIIAVSVEDKTFGDEDAEEEEPEEEEEVADLNDDIGAHCTD